MGRCSYMWEEWDGKRSRLIKKQCEKETWKCSDEFCILHDPSPEKDAGLFRRMVEKQIEAETKKHDFIGYCFPDNWDFSGKKFGDNTQFQKATFQGVVDFSGATFREANFRKATFREANFRKATFREADFSGATFKDTNFGGTVFYGTAYFWGARFEGTADFSETTFQDAHFGGATFRVTYFGEAIFQGTAHFRRASFEHAHIWGTIFQHADFRETIFQHADFRETIFQHADFGGASCQQVDFSGATFQGGVDFGGAIFQGTPRFKGGTLRNANFSDASFQKGVDFSGTTFLDTAHFRGAVFQDTAHFRGAVFQHADFGETIFQQADFSGVTFLSAEFWKVVFQGTAEFREAAFQDTVDFRGAVFQKKAELALRNTKKLDLRQAEFLFRSHITADLTNMLLYRAFIGNVVFHGYTWDRKMILYEEKHMGNADIDLSHDRLETIYRDLKQNMQNYGDYTTAGEFYYREMEMRRKGTSKKEHLWLTLYKAIAGYGERPQNTALVSGSLVFLFAFLYAALNCLNYSVENPSLQQKIIDVIYFSFVTFTTLGLGDIAPATTLGKVLICFEAVIGAFMIAVFVVVFVRKMAR